MTMKRKKKPSGHAGLSAENKRSEQKKEADQILRALRCGCPEEIGLMDLVFMDDFLAMEVTETR